MASVLSKEALRRTADHVYSYMLGDHCGNWGMDMRHWDWVPGVGVISILEFYEQSKQEEIMEQLIQWSRQHLSKSEQLKVINSMAPFAIFPALYRHTGDTTYLDLSIRIGQWMLNEAPRTREGAFEHTVTEKAAFPEQVWADTVFMAVLFLARLARQTKNKAYADEAVSQLALHLRLLQDETTGVLFHGWNSMARNHMSAARWTRANAWIAVGTPMILEELEGIAAIPPAVTERYASLMKALPQYQQESGLWTTVMDRSDFYEEVSGSAGIACGIFKAVRLGLLEEDTLAAACKALSAVLAQIDEKGAVLGVSGGTPVMPSIEAYNEIPCYPTLYGQGLVLGLLAEALRRSLLTDSDVGSTY
ncbi:glycoside hydrolase family 105 protein [Cohnella sp.]|uniref:glycoside hydrolase family 88/105 protein n=1 Tax=Cohnella sp. TaxID=1883426 RepID=UPI003563C16B